MNSQMFAFIFFRVTIVSTQPKGEIFGVQI